MRTFSFTLRLPTCATAFLASLACSTTISVRAQSTDPLPFLAEFSQQQAFDAPFEEAADERSDNNYIIHAGHLIAEPGKPVRSNVTIIVRNGAITDIKDGLLPGTNVLDLTDYYVLPGMIDLHTHVTMDLKTLWKFGSMERPTRVLLRTLPRLRQILDNGFTTIRDLIDKSEITYELSAAIENGTIVGPRMIASEPNFDVGQSYGSAYTNGMREELEPYYRGRGVCNGAEECRAAVREEIRRGAGVIKLSLSLLPLKDNKIKSVESMEELRAIIDTAHQLNRTVAAHSSTAPPPEEVALAIEAGADSIEHGPIEEVHLAGMKRHGTAYIPTQHTAFMYVKEYPGAHDRVRAAVIRSHRAGIKMGFGSDLPHVPVDETYKELIEFQDSGLSAAEALKTATVNAAEILRMSDVIGSITPGKHADIIAVSGNPLNDLNEMGNVKFVMKEGRIYKYPHR